MRRLVMLLVVTGCAAPVSTAPAPVASPPAVAPSRTTDSPVVGAATAPAPPASEPPFVENDVAAALDRARTQGKALFVDAWAPWCHTCLSMRHFVLDDPRVLALSERVVFAAIDTDREENWEFVERVDVQTWPTFYVVDPGTGEPVDAWAGAASATELVAFVLAALDTIEAASAGSRASDAPEHHLALAKRAEIDGDLGAAARAYHAALAAPAAFTRRGEAALGAIRSLSRAGAWQQCVDVGAAELAGLGGAAVPADFASFYLACVAQVTPRRPHVERIVARLSALADAPPSEATPDDRADSLRILADAHDALGDASAARVARERRLGLLEEAARAAPSPAAAETFDAARTSTYLALGRADAAIDLLTARQSELPTSYGPPSRLAGVLRTLGRHDEALAALEVAISRSYGLVRPRLLARKAELLAKLGRHDARIATLTDEVAAYEAAPVTAMNARRLADARRRLAAARRETAGKP